MRLTDRDTMLAHFGYPVEAMTPKAKHAAADRMTAAYELDQYKVLKAPIRYDLDQVLKAKQNIKPLARKAA